MGGIGYTTKNSPEFKASPSPAAFVAFVEGKRETLRGSLLSGFLISDEYGIAPERERLLAVYSVWSRAEDGGLPEALVIEAERALAEEMAKHALGSPASLRGLSHAEVIAKLTPALPARAAVPSYAPITLGPVVSAIDVKRGSMTITYPDAPPPFKP